MRNEEEIEAWIRKKKLESRVQCWVTEDLLILGAKGSSSSGLLLVDLEDKSIHATAFHTQFKFAQLARGKYKSQEESPMRADGTPKGLFLMLLAARSSTIMGESKRSPTLRKYWRELAIKTRRAELELARGGSLSSEPGKAELELVDDGHRFEEIFGFVLVQLMKRDTASAEFHRLGKWLARIEALENEGMPDEYAQFLAAVGVAAGQTGEAGTPLPIPDKKKVQAIFEAGLSENQRGSGSTFRTLCAKLGFNWLPEGPRGPGLKNRVGG